MISTDPLYDPIRHRYKGVYPGPGRDQWDAIPLSPEGVLERKGRFNTQDEAARVVAEYYRSVYGDNWAEVIKTRNRMRRDWRIKKIKRFPYMADLHRGPSVTVYVAEIKVVSLESWHKIQPVDIVEGVSDCEMFSSPNKVIQMMWNDEGKGWRTIAAATVAIRIFRHSRRYALATAPVVSELS